VNIGFYLLIMKLHCWTFYSGCKLYWKHARLKSFTSLPAANYIENMQDLSHLPAILLMSVIAMLVSLLVSCDYVLILIQLTLNTLW